MGSHTAEAQTPTIVVYCGSHVDSSEPYQKQARQIGKEAAKRQYSIVVGGGLTSSIGAVVTAARTGGAHVAAVVPNILVGSSDRFLQDTTISADMWEWKRELNRRADAFVILPGGLGTLSELFESWVGRLIGSHNKPVVIIDHDETFAPLRDFVHQLTARGLSRRGVFEAVYWTDSIIAAYDYLDIALANVKCPVRHPENPGGIECPSIE